MNIRGGWQVKKTAKVVLFMTLLLQTSPLYAKNLKPTPLSPPLNAVIISVSDAKSLLSKAIFYDARKAMNFGKGRVPNAISKPVKWVDKKVDLEDRKISFNKNDLPKNKNSKIVVYSHGATGWKSYHLVRRLVEMGYEKVHWMREGLSGWEKAGYTVEK